MGMGRGDVVHMMNLFSPDNPMMTSCGGFNMLIDPETNVIDAFRVNTPEIRATTATSALTASTARAQATIFRNFAEGGGKLISADGIAESLANPVTALDGCMQIESTFMQGGMAVISDNMIDSDFALFAEGLIGWGGWGGSMCLVDPQRKVTYVYVMSGMDVGLLGDPRSKRLMQAYHACINQ
jgi:hypothetical protein